MAQSSKSDSLSSITLRPRLQAFLLIGLAGLVFGLNTGCGGLSSGSTSSKSTPLQFAVNSLPSTAVGSAYSATLEVTGGLPPYSFNVIAGALPAGLGLNSGSGVINGTPTSSGQFNFTAEVTDSSTKPQSVQGALSLKVNPKNGIIISTASLPNAVMGTSYNAPLAASRGTPPYGWSLASGSLPAGLALSAAGTISGTPTRTGQSSFTVQVADSSAQQQTASAPLNLSVTNTPALTITTSSLPNGTTGTAYSAPLTASSGTTPYSWSTASGTLPAGLSLSSNGTISGTPTSPGVSNFTVQVTDSTSPAEHASKPLSITVSSTSQALKITDSIAPNAGNGLPYSSTDTATGGTPAYTWSIIVGLLPPGLTLAAATGTISGTPNQNGQYKFTLQVADSGSLQQKATQADQITVVTPTVWSLQPTQVGWQFVAPDGTVSCKYNAISKVDDADLQSAGTDNEVLNKYGSWNNWALQQSNRLSSLGFTAAGQYSYRYQSSSYPQGGLPYAPTLGASLYVMRDSGLQGSAWRVKNAYFTPQANQMKCGPQYNAGGSSTTYEADPFDPIAQTAYSAVDADFVLAVDMKHAIIVVPDEADYLYGLDYHNNHGDLGLLVASNSPMVTKSQSSLGGTYNYPDATEFAKIALRDYLLNEYLCTGPGQPVSTCTGPGTGTGSADPSSGNYVGAANAANALAALNSAWSASYTTWNTSDAGGLAGIAIGTYSSYATGTGFLDENGNHLVVNGFNCSGKNGNGPSADDNWPAVPQIKTDLHLFVAAFAAQYASTLRTAWLAACGANCPPMAIPNYDGPMYTYAAMAPYTDLFWTTPAYYANPTAAAAEVQQVINNTGGKPVVVADYFRATPDSWNKKSCDNGGGFGAGEDCSPTQAIRGSTYVSLRQNVLQLKNPDGLFAVVGLEHWSLYDSKGEGRDFGLFTPNDNGYDGSAASTATSSGACATSQPYTAPAICQDSNGNYESLAVSSCTSGGSQPLWNTNFNGLTSGDGSCTWLNQGNYARIPETGNWGNTLMPIANFNTAGICDP